MADSILNDVKKMLGLAADYTAFDTDVILCVNSAISRLTQLGLGPEGGYFIEDATATWDDFLGDNPKLNSAKVYVYQRSRLVFDPPTIGFVLEMMKGQLEQTEWLLNVEREGTAWVDPNPPAAA